MPRMLPLDCGADVETRWPYRRDMGIDWVDLATTSSLAGSRGRLGMTDLAGVADLVPSDGVDTVLLLNEDRELRAVGMASIAADLARQGTLVVRSPIEDMGVPSDLVAFQATLDVVRHDVWGGRTVVVACLAGLGRTGTTVACLLVAAGLTPDEAIALTRATRPGTIERESQVGFVQSWPPKLDGHQPPRP
jgi:hypothetical protein